MADKEILSAEQIADMRAAAAEKRAGSTKKAQKERAKNEELADTERATQATSTWFKARLNPPASEGRESAEQKMARLPGTPNAKEYLTPLRDPQTGKALLDPHTGEAVPSLHGQLQKQIGRTSRISSNPNHGIYLDAMSEELAGRIAIAKREGRMEHAEHHIQAAQIAIRKHQSAHGAGNYTAAFAHLVNAADHLSDAANSATGARAGDSERGIGLRATDSEADRSGFLSDSWKPFGEDYEKGMSLERFHGELTDVVDAYRDHLKDSAEKKGEEVPPVVDQVKRNYSVGKATPVSSEGPEVKPAEDPRGARVTGLSKDMQGNIFDRTQTEIPTIEELRKNQFGAYQQHISALMKGEVKPLPEERDVNASESRLVTAVEQSKEAEEADAKNTRKKEENKRRAMTFSDAMAFAKSDAGGSLVYQGSPAKRDLSGALLKPDAPNPLSPDSTVDAPAKELKNIKAPSPKKIIADSQSAPKEPKAAKIRSVTQGEAALASERVGLGGDDEPVGYSNTRGVRGNAAFSEGHDGAKA